MAALAFTLLLFFPVSWVWRNLGLPSPVYSLILAMAQLPFAFYLGRTGTRRHAMLAAPICFLLYQAVPLIIFWIQFGKSPFSWITSDAVVYNMAPLNGYAFGLSFWLLGAWWGSRQPRRRA